MSYEAKTQNLNLPQWVSGDKPEMLDFNKAFQAIDTGVGAKQNKIAASGILKGNGAGGVSAAVAGTDYATAAQVDAKLDKTGGTVSGDLVPDVGGTRYLGSETKRWNALHAGIGYFNANILMGSANTPVASSGSNDNGNWVKFYDGTMICWGQQSWNGISITNAWGALYESTTMMEFANFPQPFTAAPSMAMFPNNLSGNLYFIEGPRGLTATSPGKFYACLPGALNNVTIGASYIAIGRWK